MALKPSPYANITGWNASLDGRPMPPEWTDADLLGLVSWVRRILKDGQARIVREEGAITLREMASAVGTDPGTVSRWECGLSSPRYRSAIFYGLALMAIEDAPDPGGEQWAPSI
jgi:hypothetical protein